MSLFKRGVNRLRRVLTGAHKLSFENSAQYWNDRYRLGGTSGAGSYGRLAEFKAAFLNNFVTTNQIQSVVEFGCGDGAQLALAQYPSYVGFDISPLAVEICRKRFQSKVGCYEFFHVSERHDCEGGFDLALSLDVIYHLIEDDVFDAYMRRLFASSAKFVIIYAYNFDKTYGSPHERGREFLKWCQSHARDWNLIDVVKNLYPYDEKDPGNTSQSDFFVFQRSGV